MPSYHNWSIAYRILLKIITEYLNTHLKYHLICLYSLWCISQLLWLCDLCVHINIWLGILWVPSVNTDICEIEFISRGEKNSNRAYCKHWFLRHRQNEKIYIYFIPHHLPLRNFHISKCRSGTQDYNMIILFPENVRHIFISINTFRYYTLTAHNKHIHTKYNTHCRVTCVNCYTYAYTIYIHI